MKSNGVSSRASTIRVAHVRPPLRLVVSEERSAEIAVDHELQPLSERPKPGFLALVELRSWSARKSASPLTELHRHLPRWVRFGKPPFLVVFGPAGTESEAREALDVAGVVFLSSSVFEDRRRLVHALECARSLELPFQWARGEVEVEHLVECSVCAEEAGLLKQQEQALRTARRDGLLPNLSQFLPLKEQRSTLSGSAARHKTHAWRELVTRILHLVAGSYPDAVVYDYALPADARGSRPRRVSVDSLFSATAAAITASDIDSLVHSDGTVSLRIETSDDVLVCTLEGGELTIRHLLQDEVTGTWKLLMSGLGASLRSSAGQELRFDDAARDRVLFFLHKDGYVF